MKIQYTILKVRNHGGSERKVNATAISEVDKNSKINGKEIELLKLQIREIQAKSGNPLSN